MGIVRDIEVFYIVVGEELRFLVSFKDRLLVCIEFVLCIFIS